jgi:hypothetical protein
MSLIKIQLLDFQPLGFNYYDFITVIAQLTHFSEENLSARGSLQDLLLCVY